jgi:hypothetical protein
MLEADTGAILSFLFFPLTLMYAIGRWVAMRTSKQPVWPAEIEAECAIAPDDPYLVDAEHVPERDDDGDYDDYDDEAVDAEP